LTDCFSPYGRSSQLLVSLSIHLCFFFFHWSVAHRALLSFPTRPSSDLGAHDRPGPIRVRSPERRLVDPVGLLEEAYWVNETTFRSEEHTSELQSRFDLVCRLLLENRKITARDRQPSSG